MKFALGFAAIALALGVVMGRESMKVAPIERPYVRPSEAAAPALPHAFAEAMCAYDMKTIETLAVGWVANTLSQSPVLGCEEVVYVRQIRNLRDADSYLFLFRMSDIDVAWTVITREGRVVLIQ